MIEHNWFEAWFNSPYYKVLYADRNNEEADGFSDALIEYLNPDLGSKMVDIGCGEGRFSVQFAKKGYDVLGIDLAVNSIKKAMEKETNHLHFLVHDMRYPFYINYFDYAFNLFTSFGYFSSQRDNLMAAKSFSNSLKKGGRLIVDYLNSDWVIKNSIKNETILKGNVLFDIQKEFSNTHIIKHIKFTDQNNNLKHYTERVSVFNIDDFVSLFSQVGLKLEATFGDYTLSPFQLDASKRLIMVFKKI
jgi:SAM-dependent methyltransferase